MWVIGIRLVSSRKRSRTSGQIAQSLWIQKFTTLNWTMLICWLLEGSGSTVLRPGVSSATRKRSRVRSRVFTMGSSATRQRSYPATQVASAPPHYSLRFSACIKSRLNVRPRKQRVASSSISSIFQLDRERAFLVSCLKRVVSCLKRAASCLKRSVPETASATATSIKAGGPVGQRAIHLNEPGGSIRCLLDWLPEFCLLDLGH